MPVACLFAVDIDSAVHINAVKIDAEGFVGFVYGKGLAIPALAALVEVVRVIDKPVVRNFNGLEAAVYGIFIACAVLEESKLPTVVEVCCSVYVHVTIPFAKFNREPLKTSLTANFLRLCASSALAKLEIHLECIP